MDAKQFNINGTTVLLKDESARNRIAAVEGKLPSDASSSNKLITKTVDDLLYYYLKSETYTKSEVEALIGAIQHFHYEVYASTSAVTNPASNVLYLIGPTGGGADKYEEYVYSNNTWVKIGDTSIDLSGYVTTEALNTALAAYTTTANLTTLLAGKQDVIADLATIRSNATSAYQKPSGGIPKSDLEQGVKDSLELADTALQSSPVGQVSPSVDPYEYATRAELEELGQQLYGANEEITSSITWTSGYTINSSGNLTAAATMKYAEIQMRKGETIQTSLKYSPMDTAIAVYNGTNYTRKVLPADATGDKPPYVYTYKCEADCTVAIIANVSGYANIYKIVDSLIDAVETNTQKIAEHDTEIDAINENMPSRKTMVAGTDYTIVPGYSINSTGLKSENSGRWVSTPIPVKAGDKVSLQWQYSMGTDLVLTFTDEQGSYYKPILVGSLNGVLNHAEIEVDGFICVSYLMQTTTKPRQLTTFEIESLPTSEADTLRKVRNGNNINIIRHYTDDTDENLIRKECEAEQAMAIRKAVWDREVMLSEIRAMTNDDVLVGGDCGYVINNNDVNDVTHGTIKWKIYKNGILYIHGYGRFYDFLKGTQACLTIQQANSELLSILASYPYNWYYGFLPQNLNNIVPPTPPDGYRYTAGGPEMTYSNKRYMPSSHGDAVNTDIQAIVSTYAMPYGYSAPWYIYRSDFDYNYQPKASYDAKNPTNIRYNRVCIEEDEAHGGITYIGDWTFYRLTAESLVLPAHVTKMGCWAVRYSPVCKTVVMGDTVTEIEDHGVSRMEAMETCKLSDALVSFGYAGMENCGALRYINFPSSLSSLGQYICNGDQCLKYILFSSSADNQANIAYIPGSGFVDNDGFVVDLPDYAVGDIAIGGSSFFRIDAQRFKIPSAISSIGASAFLGKGTGYKNSIGCVILDSAAIAATDAEMGAASFISQFGYLYSSAKVLLVKSSIDTISDFYKKYFEFVDEADGYRRYVKFENWSKIIE